MKKYDNYESAGRKRVIRIALLILLAVITVNLVIPISLLLAKSVDFAPFWAGYRKVLGSGTFKTALWNSVKVTAVAASISVIAAYFFAYTVEFKLKGRLRSVFRLIAILPMLVPSITHGIVIVNLFGNMGIFTRLFGIGLDIYGPMGIIMGSFFYAFPTSFLVFSQAFITLDVRLYENARILGVKPARRFYDILLPMTRYAVFSAFTVCFTMIFTDYGVPLSVGGSYPILPILFYKNVVGLLDFSSGAIYSVFMLIPAVIVFVLDVMVFSKRQASTKSTTLLDTGKFLTLQKLFFVFLTFVIVVCLSVILFIPFVNNWPYSLTPTLKHFKLINNNGKLIKLLGNSLLISFGTAAFGTLLSFSKGYLYVRDQNNNTLLKKATHGLYTATLAIPGLALGLGFVMFFKGSFLYGTIALLIIVNVIHFFGSPYMMTISHFKLLDPNFESVCRSLGASYLRMLADVIIPCSKKLLTDVFVYFFTNTMITISAVSMLYNSRTMTLAVQITAFNDQGSWESAVSVSLVILLVNVMMKIVQEKFLSKPDIVSNTPS